MSLATRCPACGTIFRVVQDQLKVSEGWVRCGQCHEVFHGIEALFDLDSDPAIAARRAAVRNPAAPPPTRVFADARASAPIPMPTPPAAPAPIAIPARTPPPVPTARAVQATPSAFGPSTLPPASGKTPLGQRGFAPASGAPAPAPAFGATTSPMQPIATRGTIAPRFAARLAEESARAQGVPPPAPIPTAFAISAPPPFGSALAQHVESSGTSPAPVPVPVVYPPPPAFAAPVSYAPVPAPAPAPVYAPPPAPVFAPAQVHLSPPALPPTPAAPPSASELAAEFAAPPPAPAFVPSPTPAAAPLPASDLAPEPEPTDAASATALDVPQPSVPDQGIDGSNLLPTPDDDESRAGPPTLASMLPEDAGEWPPKPGSRRKRERAAADDSASTEVALVDKRKDPRFLREAKSGARWRRPWVRAALSVALLLLVVSAGCQYAWPQRDTLAARWPATLPAWNFLCEQAGCTIEAPRAIASLALDGSSLTRTDTDHVLLFSADLHNRADHAVRMPSFDLTFMDLNGEIVARKVLTPAQIGIRQAALPPEGELHVHARLQVGGLDASGFQADLFYP